MTTQPAPATKKKMPLLVSIFLALCIICVVISMINSGLKSVGLLPTDTPFPSPTTTSAPTATIPPTVGPTLTPDEQVRALISGVLGKGNRNMPRLTSIEWSPSDKTLTIKWAIDDNLTEDFIKRGAKMDVEAMLKAIDTQGIPYDYDSVVLDGSFALVDAYGNTSEQRVVLLTYYRSTIEKINWDNFLTDNMYVIADSVYIHPAFK